MKIAFYYANKGQKIDKAISFWTNGPYSHCEIIFSDNIFFSSSYRDNGVRFKQIINLQNWNILDINLKNEEEIRSWCEKQIGKQYDLLGVFMQIPKLNQLQDKNKWYCSEICSTILKKFGNYQGSTTISPNKLFYNLASKLDNFNIC